MMRWKKAARIFYITVTSVLAVLFIMKELVLPRWYLFREHRELQAYYPQLDSLSRLALLHNDVPVSALLLYEGAIIGRGYNTVERDRDICAHAEIKALADASGTLGPGFIKQSDKSKLVLISSFEPCLMCRGALAEHGITKVIFVLPKTGKDYYQMLRQEIKYHYHRQQSADPWFQYQLFQLHPDFDTIQYPFRFR